MSVEVRPPSDHCADLRVMTNNGDDCEAENLEVAKIARIESRPLNLTQFTKRNGRKRRTPQKAMASSEGYQSDSSGAGSSPNQAGDDESRETSILEHYRSFMQRNSNDPNGSVESVLQKASKKQRLSKSMSTSSVVDSPGNSLLNWHNFTAIQQQQQQQQQQLGGDADTSSASSPSFSDVAVNGSGLSGLIPERTMRQNNWAIKVTCRLATPFKHKLLSFN